MSEEHDEATPALADGGAPAGPADLFRFLAEFGIEPDERAEEKGEGEEDDESRYWPPW